MFPLLELYADSDEQAAVYAKERLFSLGETAALMRKVGMTLRFMLFALIIPHDDSLTTTSHPTLSTIEVNHDIADDCTSAQLEHQLTDVLRLGSMCKKARPAMCCFTLKDTHMRVVFGFETWRQAVTFRHLLCKKGCYKLNKCF